LVSSAARLGVFPHLSLNVCRLPWIGHLHRKRLFPLDECGSSDQQPSIPGLMAPRSEGGLDATAIQGILGLTLFILGYGSGAMFLTPLQEIPHIGRNPVYVAALFVFVIFQLPIIYSYNIHTILVFRYLTGFAGSPALATVCVACRLIFCFENVL
jgi:DHA1 family multidrug resistance protein-like MFS transporter